jgi:hypothetical protein
MELSRLEKLNSPKRNVLPPGLQMVTGMKKWFLLPLAMHNARPIFRGINKGVTPEACP